MARGIKYSYDDVNQFFKDRGLILLNKVYVNQDSPLQYICRCGEIRERDLRHILNQEYFCKQCRSTSDKMTQQEARGICKDNNYTLLSAYNGYNNKVQVQCDKGHTTWKQFATINKGSKCGLCNFDLLGNTRRLSLNHVKAIFNYYDCKLLSDYKDNKTPLEFICHCNKKGRKCLASFKKYPYCVECGNKNRIEAYKYNATIFGH